MQHHHTGISEVLLLLLISCDTFILQFIKHLLLSVCLLPSKFSSYCFNIIIKLVTDVLHFTTDYYSFTITACYYKVNSDLDSPVCDFTSGPFESRFPTDADN